MVSEANCSRKSELCLNSNALSQLLLSLKTKKSPLPHSSSSLSSSAFFYLTFSSNSLSYLFCSFPLTIFLNSHFLLLSNLLSTSIPLLPSDICFLFIFFFLFSSTPLVLSSPPADFTPCHRFLPLFLTFSHGVTSSLPLVSLHPFSSTYSPSFLMGQYAPSEELVRMLLFTFLNDIALFTSFYSPFSLLSTRLLSFHLLPTLSPLLSSHLLLCPPFLELPHLLLLLFRPYLLICSSHEGRRAPCTQRRRMQHMLLCSTTCECSMETVQL